MKKKLFRRFIGVFLALLMVIEPAIIPALQAQESSGSSITIIYNGMEQKTVPTPSAQIKNYFASRGASNDDEVAIRAWSEWGSMLAAAYSGLDKSSTDALTFYDGIKKAKDIVKKPKDVKDKAEKIMKKTMWASGHLKKLMGGETRGNTSRAMTGILKVEGLVGKIDDLMKKPVFQFLDFMSLPKGMTEFTKKATDAAGRVIKDAQGNPVMKSDPKQTTKAFIDWLKADKSTRGGGFQSDTQLNNVEGAGRCVGIALAVIGLALDSYKLGSDWYNAPNKGFTWTMAKDTMSIVLDVIAIVGCFIPVYGWIVTAVILAIKAFFDILKAVGDTVGEFHKCWRDAYYASSWFLEENDPDYKTFKQSIGELDDNEKSDTLIFIENTFKDKIATEGEAKEKDEGIYEELEKQGILTSYYARQEYELASFDITFLEKLWDAKQDYMAYKPTEEEAKERENESGWDKFCRAINPKTWIKSGMDWLSSGDYEDLCQNKDLKKVYFNPDYILIKKYNNFVNSNKLTDAFYKIIGLRIEMSPFNYLPLVGVELGGDVDKIDEVLWEALNCDAFMVGQKELKMLSEFIDATADDNKDKTKEINDEIKEIRKNIKHIKEVREELEGVADNYSSNSETKIKTFDKACGKKLNLQWSGPFSKDSAEPETICKTYRDEIEETLLMYPIYLGYSAYGVLCAMDMAKSMMDSKAIMNNYYEERLESLNNFDSEFSSSYRFKDYLKDGTFLNHEKHGFLEWLSEVYPIYTETESSLTKLKRAVEKYEKKMKKLDEEDYKDALQEVNDELKEWQSLVDKFSSVSDSMDERDRIRVFLAECDAMAKDIFNDCDYKLPYTFEPIDPKAELPTVTYEVTED